MIQLKTHKPGDGQQYAQLIEPDVNNVRSDTELYAAVQQHGFAVISEYDGISYDAKPPVRLGPTEFASKWGGD
jgi:hypothetical protein